MSDDQSEQKVTVEIEKMEQIVTIIEDAIKQENTKLVIDYLDFIIQHSKPIQREANSDQILYYVLKLVNQVTAINPNVKSQICKTYTENLNWGIRCAKFEKQVLLELKKQLLLSKKTEDYHSIPDAYQLMIAVFLLQSNRKHRMGIANTIWHSELDHLTYDRPVLPDPKLTNFQNLIREEMGKLKK